MRKAMMLSLVRTLENLSVYPKWLVLRICT
jgi:hypothetical protein